MFEKILILSEATLSELTDFGKKDYFFYTTINDHFYLAI